MRTNASDLFRTRMDNVRAPEDSLPARSSPLRGIRVEDERRTKDIKLEDEQKNLFETSTFNPDMLNKFLEEYVSKIKGSTEKYPKYPFRVVKPAEPLLLEVDESTTQSTSATHEHETNYDANVENTTSAEDALSQALNDTLKRNKFYGANSYEDRNGWVTLEAIPWSKSKISKWQATATTQRPWPEAKPWEKPGMGKPWASDYAVRPIYENNKPWYQEKPTEIPWQKLTSRPTYYSDKNEENQAQKWPPERPSWNKYTDRPNSDIITDNRPANFPSTWNRPPQPTKPSYQFIDRYTDKNQAEENNDWHDFPPNRYEDRPRPTTERPGFSQYQYVNNHPQSYPGNSDGQWVLLSTNRGYSKSRQRSIKIDSSPSANGTKIVGGVKEDQDPAIAVMTSKRQADGVTVNQRYEHYHISRRSAGSGEDVQERGPEPKGVRVGETDLARYPEEEADQKYARQSAF
ncbi:uncharacterized protein LOC143360921 isoform X2 [Halictus rubicundus]|uniref:uncharacterized protein LOC143360921 isoform X2 n=1 Tax=Halictus rubicundus TaxID=77578 RepID=UPI004036F3F7